MPRKRIHSTVSADAGAIPAPLAKPRHRAKPAPKIVEESTPTASTPQPAENEHEQIALLAYSYWEARGRTGGSAEEDWLRAEREYRNKRDAR